MGTVSRGQDVCELCGKRDSRFYWVAKHFKNVGPLFSRKKYNACKESSTTAVSPTNTAEDPVYISFMSTLGDASVASGDLL